MIHDDIVMVPLVVVPCVTSGSIDDPTRGQHTLLFIPLVYTLLFIRPIYPPYAGGDRPMHTYLYPVYRADISPLRIPVYSLMYSPMYSSI